VTWRRLGLAAVLAVLLVTAYAPFWLSPFRADDLLFIEKVEGASFASLWANRGTVFSYWRPIPTGVCYWTSIRLFGHEVIPLHLLAGGLWIAILMLYFALARQVTGSGRAAGVSTAGVAVLAAWSLPIFWVAGLQDLCMLAAFMAALVLLARGRVGLSALAYAAALASKEPAFVFPAVALAFLILVQREPWKSSLLRLLPHAALTVAWAAIHPRIGGGMWRDGGFAPGWHHPSLLEMGLGTILAALNLDQWPNPKTSPTWTSVLQVGLAVALVALFWRAPSAPPRSAAGSPVPASSRRPELFGIVWAGLALIPLAEPTLPWNAYYALPGCMGLWLAAGPTLSRNATTAMLVVAALAAARAGRASTVSTSIGTEYWQRLNSATVLEIKHRLMAAMPNPPRGSRFLFAEVPPGAGLFGPTGRSDIVAQWYGDPSLQSGYYSKFDPSDSTTSFLVKIGRNPAGLVVMPKPGPARDASGK